MADDNNKEKSANQLLQALDALSQLNQARANRRATTSLALPRSGSGKDGDDALAVKEARPRIRRRSSLPSPSPPSWSKPNKLGKNGKYDDEELEGDDGALIIIIKSKGSSADAARPEPRRRFSLMLPYESRSKLDKREDYDDDDAEEEDDDDDEWAYSALLKSRAAPEAEIMSWDPNRARSHVGMRRIGCLFSMDVVAALGLPPSMDGLRLAVTVRRKETRDGAAQTKPARVQLGAAYFDEALYVRCHLYGTGEPRPFLLSLVAVDAPELDLGRSTVDLSLFAKEFTDTCVRQWDMVFPLAGRAKGGELVVKLAIQSIDSQPAGEDKVSSKIRRRRNVLTPKMSRTKAPKLDEEHEPEPTPTDEVKQTQQEEPEHEPAGEPTSVAEVKEEEQQEGEPTPVAELEEEEQKEPECQPADEPTSVAELKEEEQQKEPESEPADEPTPVIEVKEEEQQKEQQQHEPADEPESTPVLEVKEEDQQKDQEIDTADEPAAPVAMVNEEEQQRELESEAADDSTPVAEVKEEVKQKESEHEPADDTTTPVAELEEEEEEKQKGQEWEPENTQEDDGSEQPEVHVIDKDVEGQEVKAELTKEEVDEATEESEAEASLFADDEVAKAVRANGLEDKFAEVTMPSDVSEDVPDDAEPVDANSARLDEVTGESLQVPEDKGAVAGAVDPALNVPEQGEGKGAAAKPARRPRFKWRTVAVLVPVAVLFNKTLGVNR